MSNLEIVKELEKKIFQKEDEVMIHIISKPCTKVTYSKNKFRLKKRNVKWIREAFSLNKNEINFLYSPLSFILKLKDGDFATDIFHCEKIKDNEYKLMSDVSLETHVEFLFLI